MSENTVLVVGTGTIGEPLTGLLANLKKEIGIDNLIFYKHTPRLTDRPMMRGLLKKGSVMCAQKEKFDQYREMGLEPSMTFEEAIDEAKVIVDCSIEGIGVRNKHKYYEKVKDKKAGFLAQGSEHGFGFPFAVGINDEVLEDRKFIQVVSCNTHNCSRMLYDIAFDENRKGILAEGRFLLMRRATDISQQGFIPSPSVGIHKDETFGTHHAKDVYRLYSTLGYHLNVFSSAIKLNTQLMHIMNFSLTLDADKAPSLEEIEQRFADDPFVATTYKLYSNLVFSFGREYGHFGRILNQTVVPLPTMLRRKSKMFSNKVEIIGYAFTPQDGNSLLSSTSAVAYYLNPEEVTLGEPLDYLKQYMFNEV